MTSGITPFREWCKKRNFGPTYGYKLLNSGAIKAVKIGRLTYITDEEDQRWLDSLPKYEPVKKAHEDAKTQRSYQHNTQSSSALNGGKA